MYVYENAEALILELEHLDQEGFYEIDYTDNTVVIDTAHLKLSTLESLLKELA